MRIRVNIIFSVLALLVALVGMGIWYASSLVNPTKLAALLTSSVKTATGRDLRIAGPVKLQFFPGIAVSAEQLTLSNASWGSQRDFLTLDQISLNIKLLPLLSKRVDIDSIELKGLDLFLQKNRSGQANWVMGSQGPLATNLASNKQDEAPASQNSLMNVGNVMIANANVHYLDPTGLSSIYQVQRLSLTKSGAKTLVAIDIKYKALALEIRGKTDSVLELMQHWNVSPAQFALDLNVGINGKSILIQGNVAKNPKTLPLIDLAINSAAVDWPSSDAIGNPPVQQSTRLSGQNLKTASAESVQHSPSTYFFSDANLPLDLLPEARGKISIGIIKLGLPGRQPIENLNATIEMDGSQIAVPQLTFGVGQGQANLALHLTRLDAASPVVTAKGVTANFTLESLMARLDPNSKVGGGKMKLAFNLQSAGMSAHQMASNASGKIQIRIDQAKTDSLFLNSGGDFVVTLLDAINPLRKKSNQNTIECAVAYLPISQGQLNIANTVGMETDRLNVLLGGTINLKTEAVNLMVEPYEKSGLTTGIDLGGLVKIGGTLQNPKPMINQAGVISSAISVGLGFLTGGASILAENALSLGKKGSPCKDVLRPWADIYPGAE
ncbi:AsmA family protein [Polynucleobacter sp. TUM22923]|uniref:AsmA family protein n=1 Tax=Polynucleobacter sp. TUM22923 TaxID=3022126 RepID=UPI002572C78A|nr:AsmA family protein [Polynucleobacter sp. TUM22923]